MRGRSIPHQKDARTFSGVLFGELIEKELHTVGVQSRQHQPEDASRSRMSRGIEPEPFVALVNDGKRTLSSGCPDTPQNRLETEASFVLTPDFYLVRRRRLLESLRLKC